MFIWKRMNGSMTNYYDKIEWQMTAENKNATFASVHLKEAFCMDSIKKQSVCIKADCGMVIKDLL